eukprot:1161868-Pelagomonas_calceolata.AAC.4
MFLRGAGRMHAPRRIICWGTAGKCEILEIKYFKRILKENEQAGRPRRLDNSWARKYLLAPAGMRGILQEKVLKGCGIGAGFRKKTFLPGARDDHLSSGNKSVTHMVPWAWGPRQQRAHPHTAMHAPVSAHGLHDQALA